MVYAIDGTKLRTMIQVQYSKIGYGYARIFIEGTFIKDATDSCVNIDCSMGSVFEMKQKDFDDYWKEAEHKSLQDACDIAGLKYAAIKDLFEAVEKEVMS